MTKTDHDAESSKLHEDFSVLMARLVVHVGSERAIMILRRAIALFTKEAKASGHTPPRSFT